MQPSIRPNVLAMHPYSPGKPIDDVKRELGIDDVVKLASNENPLGPSPLAVEAVRKAAEEMHIYPDGAAFTLKEALSQHYSVPSNQIMVGNGSDELIHLLGQVFLGDPADEVIVGVPSFVRYDAAAQLAPCMLLRVPLDSELRHDLDAMSRAISERTKLVFIANPNNPTGTIVRRTELRRFVEALPKHVTLVLDEAYFEFGAEDPDYPNSIEFLSLGLSVIGLRTFSKAYGLAGLRIGFGFAPNWVVDAVERAREPFNTNLLAQRAATAALNDAEHIRATLENNRAGLNRIVDALAEAGFTPYESYANFVFADCGEPAGPIFQALLREGVIVRGGDSFGCPSAIRVSVGTPDEVSRFVDALRKVRREVSA